MFAFKTYLRIGDIQGTSLLDIAKVGYEISNFQYSFNQGTDAAGKAETNVHSGAILFKIKGLAPDVLMEWAVSSRKYYDGAFIIFDDQSNPIDKLFFKNAACISFDLTYTDQGKGYIDTSIMIQAETLIFGNGLDFDNNWIK